MSAAVKEPLREAFEAAVRAEHGDGEYSTLVLQRAQDGSYSTTWVAAAWWGWQAATRRASAREAGNAPERIDCLYARLDQLREECWAIEQEIAGEITARDERAAAAPEQKPEAQ